MHRTYVRRRIGAAALVLLVGWAVPAAAGAVAPRGDGPAAAAPSVVIQPGDTLWTIAQRAAPTEDPRAVVDRIVAANRVDPGALVPGQAVLVPAA